MLDFPRYRFPVSGSKNEMMRPLPLATCLALLAALPLMAVHAYQPTPSEADAQATAEAAEADQANAEATEAAETVPPAPAAAVIGDPDHGRMLTYTCHGCHGVIGYKNAYPNFHVPKIGGQSTEYLTAALQGYKQGTRKHPTMQAQAESFSDQDIADLAAYLSTLK